MAKRRITKQQSARIKKQQQSYQNVAESDISPNTPEQQGVLITRYGPQADVETLDGHIIRCALRQNLSGLVAGDRVVWKEVTHDKGVIIARSPRQTVLGRPDKKGNIKAIAANVNQLMIVVAPKPEISSLLLDSYLVIAETLQFEPVILLNKADIKHQKLDDLLSLYQAIGYQILSTSTKTNEGISELIQVLQHHTSVFVGQSGVGKSSLISTILPEQDISIGAISEATEFGRHTTTISKLYRLPQGGDIIDSPGIREFGLWHMDYRQIAQGFKEFAPFLNQCKFNDCKHGSEPGCAVHQAVGEHKIDLSRYQSYLKLCESKT